jgi:uncharacterized protein YcbK (DUF882 family)
LSDPGIDTTLDTMDRSPLDRPVERRRLLQWLAAGPAVLALGGRGRIALAGELHPEVAAPRELSMVSTHTGESLAIRYFETGQYLPAALQRLNHLLRDHRTGEVKAIDPALFDRLHALALCARCAPRYEIISGYRSPATNLLLRETGSGVAKHSLHMDGRAIDVRLAGTSCGRLRDLALAQQCGGVGYYAKSDFVHLDTGRVRAWTG